MIRSRLLPADGLEVAAQQADGEGVVVFHAAFGHAQAGGYLAVAQAVQLQQEDFALLPGQPLEGLAEAAVLVLLLQQLVQAGVGQVVLQQGGVGASYGAVFGVAQLVERGVFHQGVEVVADAGADVERGVCLPKAHEDLLHEVFGAFVVLQVQAGEVAELGVVDDVELGEGLVVAAAQFIEQRLVVGQSIFLFHSQCLLSRSVMFLQ